MRSCQNPKGGWGGGVGHAHKEFTARLPSDKDVASKSTYSTLLGAKKPKKKN
jgi:hypothetical protein